MPRETSRVSEFIIERGTTVDVELTSDHYRWSPLVQGGVEIKCKVTVKVLNATRRLVTESYRALVEELYAEPKEEEIFGSFSTVLVHIKGVKAKETAYNLSQDI